MSYSSSTVRQRPAWLRNQTRWAVYCAGVLFLAGFVWIQVREQLYAHPEWFEKYCSENPDG